MKLPTRPRRPSDALIRAEAEIAARRLAERTRIIKERRDRERRRGR